MMALSSRQTIKDAYRAFKTYPKIKSLIWYYFVPNVMLILTGALGTIVTKYPLFGVLIVIGAILSTILSVIITCKVIIAIVNYRIENTAFSNFIDFWKITPGVWRLLWKTFLLPFFLAIVILTPFFIISGLIQNNMVALILLWAIPTIAVAWIFPKFMIVIPYLAGNKEAGLREGFFRSNGYYWYLTKVFTWIILLFIGIGLIPVIVQIAGLALLPEKMGITWAIIMQIAGYIIQYTLIIFTWFATTWACYDISKGKSVK
jgi:hypothetical protein